MGKTPAQENRAQAKKQGMAHDKMKSDAAKEAHKLKQLANKDLGFGKAKGAGMNTKAEKEKQRLRDLADPTTELGRAAERERRKKQKEELEYLLHKKGISVKQPPLEEGQDPKTVLCEFFRYACCSKTGDRCKFSHDMGIVAKMQAKKRELEREKLEEKRNIYETQEDLEAVIDNKHGDEANSKNATTIICKHFLEAIETTKYGWFWNCPSGPTCQYKHKLPEGYVLKKDLRQMLIDERMNRKTDTDILADKLADLEMGDNKGSTVMTDEVFADWRKRKFTQRAELAAAAVAARQKKNLFTGKELMEKGEIGIEDDEAMDVGEFLQDIKDRDEAAITAAAKEAEQKAATAKAERENEPAEPAAPPQVEATASAEAPPDAPPAETAAPPPPPPEAPAAEPDDGLTPTMRKKLKKKQQQEEMARQLAEKKAAAAAAAAGDA
uniref:C3H1-type domain-containing protein n=1 Tax=Pyramimonas obovata TaxID=1411642 RepID=A0A7S0N231_9CHLO|mmetsp:Transcript_18849/g.41277  ORF Transcript_18849/g.41277 Transcript_18849/m.41277 type:complete len:439 (+) Transcript_18849:104-1420(+)|eukprot:CAMPEP_0118933556 /NCGR_PEP_ID=MMETSP1169-20130426/12058_1 /TAXON_ID=36882 /ORGANISM="Pyramimonas obovata, Strain CCMP722" /LENGTH=438 /DNA_ID=CAMNT_0006876337 /DNA_START=62 /DNA_END=1378 /DNA_ORIENTATION=+